MTVSDFIAGFFEVEQHRSLGQVFSLLVTTKFLSVALAIFFSIYIFVLA